MSDKTRRAQLVTILAEAFRQTATRATLLAYEIGLSDVPLDALESAVHRAIRGCRFMPACSELRQMAGELLPGDRAVIAWAAVQRAVPHSSVDFDDPLINAAVRQLGGWTAMLQRPADDFDKWVRKDFLATYESLLRTGATTRDCRPCLDVDYPGTPQRIETGLPPSNTPRIEPVAVSKNIPRVTLKKP